MGELQFIASKREGGMPDVWTFNPQIPDLLQKINVPLTHDTRWTDLAATLGAKYELAAVPDWKKAAWYYKVVYDLKKDEASKVKLAECSEHLEGAMLPPPAGARHITPLIVPDIASALNQNKTSETK